MKIIFCGTPQFAVPALEKLLAENHEVELVLTNPDEPSGRGYERKSPPIKQAAEKATLKIYQPAKLRDAETQTALLKFNPDVIVVVAYGHIIPPWLIDLPRLGCINLHASLLPKYRGAAPIQWAIARGERRSGVTTMKIDAGLDTGDILLQREMEIRDDDTTETLSERMSVTGAALMAETLRGLERGEITPRPQDSSQATLAPALRKTDGLIEWNLPAKQIAWRVRGLRPWPGAFTSFRGKTLHVWSARAGEGKLAEGSRPGALLSDPGTMSVVCGEGTRLDIQELQLEGRKRLSAREFMNGVRLTPDEKLG